MNSKSSDDASDPDFPILNIGEVNCLVASRLFELQIGGSRTFCGPGWTLIPSVPWQHTNNQGYSYILQIKQLTDLVISVSRITKHLGIFELPTRL